LCADPLSLSNNDRKNDYQIKAPTVKRGVIGSSRSQVKEGIRPSAEEFLDFIDNAVKLFGPNHFGTGLGLPPSLSK
jgi:hypothetical protein